MRLIHDRVRSTIQRFGRTTKALRSRLAPDDLQAPRAARSDGLRRVWPLIALIGEHRLDEREASPRAFVQDPRRAVAVLHMGGVDHDPQHQAKRVDEDMALDAFGLLARVKARFLRLTPPFSADLTVWLSMIAAVGCASRSAASRSAA